MWPERIGLASFDSQSYVYDQKFRYSLSLGCWLVYGKHKRRVMLKNSEISAVGHAAVDQSMTTFEPSSSNVELARFLNLREITSRRGSKTRLAEQASLNPSVISHIVKRRYAMSDEVAHKIESTFELPLGFLDRVRAVHEYPEPMRRFLRFSEPGVVTDTLHLSSFGLGDTGPHAGHLSVTEFESLPSLKLTDIDWAYTLRKLHHLRPKGRCAGHFVP